MKSSSPIQNIIIKHHHSEINALKCGMLFSSANRVPVNTLSV